LLRCMQVAPLHEAVPPLLYGGTERVVSYLTESLVELGHDVTLFASGDSATRARMVSICQQAIRTAGTGYPMRFWPWRRPYRRRTASTLFTSMRTACTCNVSISGRTVAHDAAPDRVVEIRNRCLHVVRTRREEGRFGGDGLWPAREDEAAVLIALECFDPLLPEQRAVALGLPAQPIQEL
jgi:hypothetical protein